MCAIEVEETLFSVADVMVYLVPEVSTAVIPEKSIALGKVLKLTGFVVHPSPAVDEETKPDVIRSPNTPPVNLT